VQGRLKKYLENFSVLLAEAKRRRTETLGEIAIHRATIRSRNPDFRQKRFRFYPKGTANLSVVKAHKSRVF